ncbi:MAG TPA: S-methyl-5-thioribose-1-phosphate isomerase [Thermodesulfobacteriota bacterium]|nr:S-methyl-5-thioribose-1-phosphate isomerase [Deltaproteobacteria bacterium]HNR12843.1 S-methyl-5-thioribose-1-phosphate isomerase [Thermodesulfobacteriota bacterium]HNU71615.1 S-methyl-5-thioribose-1-phosphate isomerase [Thermodesulfobacteriota bacterium]HOC38337.1 S-methyl-5-thioribose-1-phosphate isomerase [Thermodesulfobacteriota bacterium]HQO78056.1 S-methyl-5-thioribose-1-phosphate isomerase [Thermodesulfobacteriota bacterium]
MSIEPIRWKQNRLYLLDQRLLPEKERYIECRTYQDTVRAIQQMVVRGAPAIGIAAAFGIALGAQTIPERSRERFLARLEKICRIMATARPTAVNLFWAIERMKRLAAAINHQPIQAIKQCLVQEAKTILAEDIASNRQIGRYGHHFLMNGTTVLTHCNAGALATGGYGTALGVIRAAWECGKEIRVIADETRPFLQGARLTAWELKKDGIPVTVITDNMAGSLMQQGQIGAVIVGADRIAANGDTANKIGTYSVALLAKAHRIPFYVAAPLSTIDFSIKTGKEIPIECRGAEEVTHIKGKRMVPGGVPVWNPAFDVTPSAYIAAIITDCGVAEKPYRRSLKKLISD